MRVLLAVLGVTALLVAVGAFVLATVANRRHMEARRAGRTRAGQLQSALVATSGNPAEVAAAADAAAELVTVTEALTQLRETVRDLSARVDALDARSAFGLEYVEGRVEAVAAELAEDRQSAGALQALLAGAVERATAAELLAVNTRAQAETTRDVGAALTLQLEHLSGEVAALAERVAGVRADPTALRHVAVVRYDAFADLGGRMSFSLAALDDSRCGFVLTTVAGKSEARSYVRAIGHGVGDVTLSAEEQQAIEAACQSAGSRV